MHKVMISVGVLAMAGPVYGQSIEQACLQSDREAKSRALCGCIQQAADFTLSGQDQKLAARFYGEPQMAQDIRQSNNSSHEKFWDRYKNYASTASKFCR